MELVNEFIVSADPPEAWALLTDVARIAPCLPGATLQPVVDDGTYTGSVAIKVGPIKVAYNGTAAFRERDETALRMVLDARGKESSGKGSAAAIISVSLQDDGGHGTRVHVHTDLQVTGKVAQFGRSAMNDVCSRVLDQFAGNLESLLNLDNREPVRPTGAAVARAGATAPTSFSTSARAGNELDALALVLPMLRRAVPAIAAFATGSILTWLIGRLGAVRTSEQRVPRSGYGPSSASPRSLHHDGAGPR